MGRLGPDSTNRLVVEAVKLLSITFLFERIYLQGFPLLSASSWNPDSRAHTSPHHGENLGNQVYFSALGLMHMGTSFRAGEYVVPGGRISPTFTVHFRLHLQPRKASGFRFESPPEVPAKVK